MMRHAYAPRGNPPPELFGRYVLMKDYGLGWEQTGEALAPDDIGLVCELVNCWHEAQETRQRMKQRQGR